MGALPQVREKYPGICLELVLSNAERREADIAIRWRPESYRPTPEVLVAQKLGDEPFLLYATDGYLRRRGAPADPAVLAGHDVVVFSGRHPASGWCAKAFRGATVVLTAPSMQVTAFAINAGLGLGVIPSREARLLPLLRPLSPVVARGTGWMVVHPDLHNVPRIRVVIDMGGRDLPSRFRARVAERMRESARHEVAETGSRESGLNRRPVLYESTALPLSYRGGILGSEGREPLVRYQSPSN